MEKTRLFLTNLDNQFYVVKIYETTDGDSEEVFKQGTYFPYSNGEKDQMLKKAQDFGRILAKNLKTTLEIDENL